MSAPKRLSLGRLAVASMGAAMAVLALVMVVLTLLKPGPVVSLVIVFAGLIGAIAALGFVATRMVDRAAGAEQQGSSSQGDQYPGESGGETH